ncbi:hypothetical protein ACMU_13165 [Actibacterium mucosum KCTC 23349]|uniref:GH16 domain-containing protein n=1 Tax=Actibacterium mucosum KCTC 23349 TaxID=1454373 RepID=A0A037ZLB4_9RHOB|nr:family 16 glycosylhydrolase [Actibacterium mucosum]KAJ55636.1 hypothetical protein ACMU_13165 [Actibacterium mucosum KCTC 23349]
MPDFPPTPPNLFIDGSGYVLTFAEEFSGTPEYYMGHGTGSIWTTSYAPHLHDGRWAQANTEGQFFVDPDMVDLPNAFDVADGALSIKASALSAEQQVLADGQLYSSGILTTELSFSASSGYVEIRADVPDEVGFLSAFFLLPADGDWSAEIDVFEILGDDTDTAFTNVWNDGVGDVEAVTVTGLGDGYHTYGLRWTDEMIQWFIDGELVRQEANTVTEDMYLATALIVDSEWTGSPDSTTDFNDGLRIDYIHVYELESDPNRNDAIGDATAFVPIPYGNGDLGGTLFGTRWGDVIDGLAGDDVLYGRGGADQLWGGEGTDTLFGQSGADALNGGAGRDKLVGGDGDDTLIGGAGTDHLWGGSYSAASGNDTFVFSIGDGMDFVHDFNALTDRIDLSGYEVDMTLLSAHLHDRGWAVEINLSGIGGDSGDRVFLIGVELADLSVGNFDFDLLI